MTEHNSSSLNVKFLSNVYWALCDQVYGAAESAVDSIADFLNGNPESPFCFGEAPCTLDAMLYGHLLFYNLAPVVAPVVKRKVSLPQKVCIPIFKTGT